MELPKQTYRRQLGLEDRRYVPVVRDPDRVGGEPEALFYFPGCGSERLFSDVGLASIGMLTAAGAEVVLPPGYLCCGYPQTAAGAYQTGHRITTENRVLFHRVANTLNYLDIKTVIVSCGTCLDQLLQYQFQQIFPGSRLLDVHEYLSEQGIGLAAANAEAEAEADDRGYLYHDPCHSPIKQRNPVTLVRDLLGAPAQLTDRCCGEAGTLGTSRPDIANQLRFRKLQSIQDAIERQPRPRKLLTSCPACQQGLSRYRDETGLATEYIVVELARQRLGKDWQAQLLQRLGDPRAIERVLL